MRIIVPMAGRGSRLRPLTLTTPKPLLPVAGKPIVEHLVEDLARLYGGQVEEVVFIVGDFGPEVEAQLLEVAHRLGAGGRIVYQDKPLGTAHAVACATDSLEGEIVIAFADTIFRADFELDRSCDGVLWVCQVEDPRAYGVVTLDGDRMISGMVEKPQEFVSDLAIIGIYYIREAQQLRAAIQHLLENDIKTKGEFQLTDALENLRLQGKRFATAAVQEWLDCGNKANLLATNTRVLKWQNGSNVAATAQVHNSVIVPPCHIADGCRIENAVVGPYVSLGRNAVVESSVIRESIVLNNAHIRQAVVAQSLLGAHSQVEATALDLHLADYSTHS